jgi:Fe-S oxidoreductase
MSPLVMTLALLAGWIAFFYSAWRRYRLMASGSPTPEPRWDRPVERFKRMIVYALGQVRMPRYPVPGWAHALIFWGFLVLLARSMMLWGRGYDETFHLWILGDDMLGHLYSLVKDVVAFVVWAAATVFFVYRLAYRKTEAKRMSHHWEAYLILVIIWVMMVADVVYDGANAVHHARQTAASAEPHLMWYEPLGGLAASWMTGVGDSTLAWLRHGGFWTHSLLVLIFLNILPYSKHFHVVTALPNVFFQDLGPVGRLKPIENIEEAEEFGVGDARQYSWKAVLDLYTCTECGRCSDQCPAYTTGKLLSPKQFTLDVRDNLYAREDDIIGYDEPGVHVDTTEKGWIPWNEEHPEGVSEEPPPTELVPGVIDPEVIWACTTCRACEDVCPVFITYVDKIVDARRHLVLERGEIPGELANALRGVENNANPWNLAAVDRSAWTEGLDVPRVSDVPDAEILLWVGCAPAYDDRAKKIAVAMVRLLEAADVRYAILGDEEKCCGDPARRSGNEYLFHEIANANVETLNSYGVRRIVTMCPHGLNTIANEYPDFGGHYVVLSHGELLADLVRTGRLEPTREVVGRVVYHDSCYLGRYNEIYEGPRDVLSSIPGAQLVEIERSRNRGLCCGAGGGQYFKEEEPPREGQEGVRVNVRRTEQLLEADPACMATACPFCMTMISDGLKSMDKEEEIRQLDIAEVLLESCDLAK